MPAKKRNYTRAGRQALKLKGRYMGRLNALSARDRAKVKKVCREKGIAKAIVLAEKLAA